MAHLNGNASNFIYTPFPLLAQFQRTHYKSTHGVLKIEMRDTIFRVFLFGKEKKGRNILRSNCNFDFTKYSNMYFITVLKFQDFSFKQILREIKISEFRVLEFAILTNWEALNFDFYEFLHCLKAEISQINQIQAP